MSVADLDRQCIARLKPVRFGVYSSAARIMSTIGHCLAAGTELTPRQRLAMYALCWRYREQIADAKFTARVLIVERLAVEHAEVTELLHTNVSVRAWRGASAETRSERGLPFA
jgi:hypothetical protein